MAVHISRCEFTVCVCVCVYMFTTHCCVWVHLDGLSQRFLIPVLVPPRSAHFVCFSYRFRRLFYLNISALRSGQVEGVRTGIENRWVKCREQITSIGYHAWPHVTSFPFLIHFFFWRSPVIAFEHLYKCGAVFTSAHRKSTQSSYFKTSRKITSWNKTQYFLLWV